MTEETQHATTNTESLSPPPRITFEDVVKHKQIADSELKKDYLSLVKFSATQNSRKFCGNKFLYHFQIANLCRTRVKNKPSLFEKLQDDKLYQALVSNMTKLNRTGTPANRIFEADRFNGAVVFFKPATAKWIYKKYGATKVLDPTAGWGGRMLAAHALGIDYTGIDTNVNLIPAYTAMTGALKSFTSAPACSGSNLRMIWQDCLSVDFAQLDYDFVLTSPPYVNTEVYENMTLFQEKTFYTEFLIPLISRCLAHIRVGGKVCFNISPRMYNALLSAGFRAANEEFDLLQQKRLSTTKGDKIYVWWN